jgi:hypothetical protein
MKNALVLFAALLLAPVLALTAKAEPLVFHPNYAPGPADNPLKGLSLTLDRGGNFLIRWSLIICRLPR